MNNSLSIPEGQAFFTSLNTDSKKDKVLFFKAVSAPDNKLGDCINHDFYLKNIFFEIVQFLNKETGEMQDTPRIVMFDKDNVSYSCCSFGIFKALCNLASIFGAPPWNEPLHIMIKQKSSGERKFLTIELLED